MPVEELVPPRDWPTLGPAVAHWIETYLCHGPGDVDGESIFLDDELARWVDDLYRLYPKGHAKAGRRVVAYGEMSLPKGRAKSEFAGMLVCAEFLGPVRFERWATKDEPTPWHVYAKGDPVGCAVRDPFIRCLATEETQTGETFGNVVAMLEHAKEKHGGVFATLEIGTTRIYKPGRGKARAGEIRPCSAGAASKDGGKETFAVADEVHLYYLPELVSMHDMVRRNCQKRKIAQPWMLVTTTMFRPGQESVAESNHREAERLRGLKRRSYTFARLYRCGTITEADWDDDAAQIASLEEAYGPAAEWHDLDAKLDNDIRAPGAKQGDAARYWHNLVWRADSHVVDLALWDDLADAKRNPTPGDPVVICFDGSDGGTVDADHTVIGLWSSLDGRPHFTLAHWFEPVQRAGRWEINRHAVKAAMAEILATFDVRGLVADPWGWAAELEEWEATLEALPHEVLVERWNFRSHINNTRAITRMQAAIAEGSFTHDGSEQSRWYAGNAVLQVYPQRSGQDFFALAKERHVSKIDGFVAAHIGFDVLASVPDSAGVSEYVLLSEV